MIDDPRIGSLFAGRFQIDALLGEGGFGRVYRATHTVLKRQLALKVIQKDNLSDPTIEARFRREARAASRIQHPNVAYVFDFGRTEDGTSYLAMEYVEGPTLAEVGPLPPSRALGVLTQIADGLAAAHACNVVHRDIKPDNVALTTHEGKPDHVKILDFGLAKALGTETWGGAEISAVGLIYGTPEYCSPEQFEAKPLGLSSDIYSVGVLAFELLTGRLPFDGTVLYLYQAHVNRPPPPPSRFAQIPADLDRVVLDCLAKDPNERPDAHDLARRMRQISSQQETGDLSEGPAAVARGRTERFPYALAPLGIIDDGSTAALERLVEALFWRDIDLDLARTHLARVLVNAARAEQLELEIRLLGDQSTELEQLARLQNARLQRALSLVPDDDAGHLSLTINELGAHVESEHQRAEQQRLARQVKLEEVQSERRENEAALRKLLSQVKAALGEEMDAELFGLFGLVEV